MLSTVTSRVKRTPFQRRPAPGSRTSFAPPTAPLSYQVTKLPGKSRARRGRPTPQQVRRREAEAEHRAMSKRVREEEPWCQVGMRSLWRELGAICTSESTDGHHVLSKGRGGPNERWNYLALCHPCHMWVHAHPKLAEAAGWLAKVGASSPWPREAA